jgi:hypothetical protein
MYISWLGYCEDADYYYKGAGKATLLSTADYYESADYCYKGAGRATLLFTADFELSIAGFMRSGSSALLAPLARRAFSLFGSSADGPLTRLAA